MPGAAAATVTPLAPGGGLPADGSSGTPVAVSHPSPSAWRMIVNGTAPQVLRLRLAGVPGWHATVDGHPVHVQSFARVMLQLKLPAGRHTVELSYWPSTFSVGLVIFAVAVLGLVGAFVLSALRSRSGGSDRASDSPDPGTRVEAEVSS